VEGGRAIPPSGRRANTQTVFDSHFDSYSFTDLDSHKNSYINAHAHTDENIHSYKNSNAGHTHFLYRYPIIR
jgi:hypothetical protein